MNKNAALTLVRTSKPQLLPVLPTATPRPWVIQDVPEAVVAAQLAAAASVADDAAESWAEVQHVPTAAELSADPNELVAVCDIFGSRAQTLINVLLPSDAYITLHHLVFAI
eukprot:5035180-Pleurochrysis_carterae.AAC.1